MGCINSKHVCRKSKSSCSLSPPAPYVYSVATGTENGSFILEPAPTSKTQSGALVFEKRGEGKSPEEKSREWNKTSRKANSNSRGSFSFRLAFNHRHVQAEQHAAGWPSWLTSVAGEAVHGWVPLKADSFEKLEKVGQGTYSSVFRAREVETGRMVALKKVRFDNLQPESIRFMSREISILRRLDHPNIMKLEGLITSRLSSSIYFVFDYMEHDLAGLVSCPDINFTESQVKCYMRQLLSGIEHCHLRGIMHRDIKTSNILVNNDGILKIADFGLANTLSSSNMQALTSRVVTLWYRPPELLMGSTNYNVSVDLWSVGCVFAEIYLGKTLLKGRTEVEQLHKIFKLCGSPPDEFWKTSKLPHATMFKPQNHYESSLRDRCSDLPLTAVDLIETLLSIEPYKRGTASSALMSKYFSTEPYACDPSRLPKYPPNKEIDAKLREDIRRKKAGHRARESGAQRRDSKTRKVTQEPSKIYKAIPKEKLENNGRSGRRDNATDADLSRPPFDTRSETVKVNASHDYGNYSGPLQVAGPCGFTWAKGATDAASILSDGSKSKISALDPTFAEGSYKLSKDGHRDIPVDQYVNRTDKNSSSRLAKEQRRLGRPDSFDTAQLCNYKDIYVEDKEAIDIYPDDQDRTSAEDMIEISGTLVSRNKFEEMLRAKESHARRKSRFEREK